MNRAFGILMVLIITFIFSSTLIYAGWERTFGGSSDDHSYSVKQTFDGGYIIAGTTNSSGNSDVWLIKTDGHGDILWTKTYGFDNSDEYGISVCQTNDSGYIIAGIKDSDPQSYFDNCLYLIKTNYYGDTLWTKVFEGNLFFKHTIVDKTSNNNIIVGIPYTGFSHCSLIICLNLDGNILWETNKFGNLGYNIQETSDNGIIVPTYDDHVCGGYYLYKLDKYGNELWSHYYGWEWLSSFSVFQTFDNGYITLGSEYSTFLQKFDSKGDSLWKKSYFYSNYSGGYSIEQLNDSGYIITGYIGNGSSSDVLLMKTDRNGDSLWIKTFGGNSADTGYTVCQTTDGGYIIVGSTYSYGAGGSDIYLIKTDSLGLAVQETVISPPGSNSCSVLSEGNNNISVNFTINRNDFVQLKLFDITGRLISKPVSGYYSSGMHQIPFQTERSGVYLYSFETSDFKEKGKIMVF